MHPVRPAQFCIPARLSEPGRADPAAAGGMSDRDRTQKSAPDNSAALKPTLSFRTTRQHCSLIQATTLPFSKPGSRTRAARSILLRSCATALRPTTRPPTSRPRLIFGNEAFCNQAGGRVMSRERLGSHLHRRGSEVISRLSVQVFHASAEQPGTLQFTGESAAWISRLNEKRLADYRRVIDTLSGNGIAGNVLLSSGEKLRRGALRTVVGAGFLRAQDARARAHLLERLWSASSGRPMASAWQRARRRPVRGSWQGPHARQHARAAAS